MYCNFDYLSILLKTAIEMYNSAHFNVNNLYSIKNVGSKIQILLKPSEKRIIYVVIICNIK